MKKNGRARGLFQVRNPKVWSAASASEHEAERKVIPVVPRDIVPWNRNHIRDRSVWVFGRPQPKGRKVVRMTLLELMKQVDVAEWKERVPSALWLIESGSPVVVTAVIEENAVLTVYKNGYVLYRKDGHITVFPLHKCREYTEEDAMGEIHTIGFEVFADQPWQVRTFMEGERRIVHNRNNLRQMHGECSLDAFIKENVYLSDQGENDPMNKVIDEETRKEEYAELHQILTTFSEKQRYVLDECIVKGRMQAEVAAQMGTTRSNVTAILRKTLDRLRRIYGISDPQCRLNRYYRFDRFAGQRAF